MPQSPGSVVSPQGGKGCPSREDLRPDYSVDPYDCGEPTISLTADKRQETIFPPVIPSATPCHSERLPLSFRTQRSAVRNQKSPPPTRPTWQAFQPPHPFAATIERPRISSRSYRHFQVSLRHSTPARHHPRAHPAKPPFPFVLSPSNHPFRSW